MNNPFFRKFKNNKKIVCLTAYDASTASILEASKVDALLVGDSLGMVVLGYSSTREVTMDEMIHHAKAVRRGAPNTFLIGDLPYKGISGGAKHALASAKRFMSEAHCNCVKVEWSDNALAITDILVKNKIPVMGHTGLTPQTITDFKVRGSQVMQAQEIYRQSVLFQNHGAFALILECMSKELAAVITGDLKIPTIGIGAGKSCDGQVLVSHDLVGLFTKFKPRFVRRYAHLGQAIERAALKFSSDVKSGSFPSNKYSYSMPLQELKLFKQTLKELRNEKN